jgi:hypothetical protein
MDYLEAAKSTAEMKAYSVEGEKNFVLSDTLSLQVIALCLIAITEELRKSE